MGPNQLAPRANIIMADLQCATGSTQNMLPIRNGPNHLELSNMVLKPLINSVSLCLQHLFFLYGSEVAVNFLAGYLIEKSLSL